MLNCWKTKNWDKKKIYAFVVLLFLSVSVFLKVSLLFCAVMLLWGSLMLYALHDTTNRAGMLVFLLAFFLFLLGGEFFELYMGYPQSYTFSPELDSHAYVALFVSLIFMYIGFAATEYRIDHVKNNSPRSIEPETLRRAQKITEIALYITVVPYFLKTLDAGLYTMQHGYLSYYTEYHSRLPKIVDTISELFTMFFFVYLATMPPKKKCILPLGLYLMHGVFAMVTGRRISFGIAALVVMFYVLIRHGKNPQEKWINKKAVIAAVIACPLVLLMLHVQRYARYGEAVEGNGVVDMLVSFLSQQGSSINVIKLQKELEGDSLGCTSLYYTIHYLRGSVLTRGIFDFPMEYYTNRTIETALETNCLADYIMYMVDANDFFAGYGLGTSYIAELNHDLGYFGVAIGSVIYGILLCWLFTQKKFTFWKLAVGMMMLEEFVILPRYGADVILRPFYNLTKMLVFLMLVVSVSCSDEHWAKIQNFLKKN